MFDPRYRPRSETKEDVVHNWEADVRKIEVKECDHTEDPLGYQVVYYSAETIRAAKDYVIGASHLAQRLEHLKKAGFYAPMTQQALATLEKHLGAGFYHA